MSVCSSGISQPKANVANNIVLTTLLAQAALSVNAPWLGDFIGYISDVGVLNIPALCGSDPPADPGVTAADILQLITVGPGPATREASEKVSQLFRRMVWPYFCECATGTLTPPAPVSAPPDLPAINPGGFVPTPSSVACLVGDFPTPVDLTANDSLIRGPLDYKAYSVTSARISGSVTPDENLEGPVITIDLIWSSIDENDVQTILHDDFHELENGPFSYVVDAFPGANFLDTVLQADSGDGTSSVVVKTELFCNGQAPGGTITPCCPPDPILSANIAQILNLVTLLQRQVAPFGYVSGPAHSGLSGNGVFDVQGVLGLLLNTSIPARAGRVDGEPVTVFTCGWVNLATEDGYTERFFVSSDNQLILPRYPGIYTHVGYSFPEDVECTITELRREP